MTQISGTAAGVPFVALPPSRPDGAPVVVLWHLLGAPGTPAAMASALPLGDVPAWRVYLELPGSGSRPVPRSVPAAVPEASPSPSAEPEAAGPSTGAGDLLIDRYAPIIERAVAELPDVLTELRAEFAMGNGPIALIGGSAGGHAALVATARRRVPIAATALINPAVRAESVMAVNERFAGIDYGWTAASRATAAPLDVLAHALEIPATTAVLLLTGESEYPEFQPDQAALYGTLAAMRDNVRHRIIDGLAHMFADEPGDTPEPPTPQAKVLDAEITGWLRPHLPKMS